MVVNLDLGELDLTQSQIEDIADKNTGELVGAVSVYTETTYYEVDGKERYHSVCMAVGPEGERLALVTIRGNVVK